MIIFDFSAARSKPVGKMVDQWLQNPINSSGIQKASWEVFLPFQHPKRRRQAISLPIQARIIPLSGKLFTVLWQGLPSSKDPIASKLHTTIHTRPTKPRELRRNVAYILVARASSVRTADKINLRQNLAWIRFGLYFIFRHGVPAQTASRPAN